MNGLKIFSLSQIKQKLDGSLMFDSTKERIRQLIENPQKGIELVAKSERGLEVTTGHIVDFLKQCNIKVSRIILPGNKDTYKCRLVLESPTKRIIQKKKRTKKTKDRLSSEVQGTAFQKLDSYFKEKQGKLVSIDELERNLNISKGTVYALVLDVRKNSKPLKLENIRGKGYIYGTEEEIKRVREELFPPKEKKERVKKEKKIKEKKVKVKKEKIVKEKN